MPRYLRTLWVVTALTLAGCATGAGLPIFPTPEPQPPAPTTADTGLIALIAILALAVVALTRRQG